ncbi:MAG TPA: hypothetical protein VF790_06160, partial [Dissulfurispiraceae bacterium]
MIPLKLRLRGFKGIRSAWGTDEIKVDLSRLPGGLIAITGPIGSGKTTLLDNLHPYRIMPYRAGDYSERAFSFYSETYGRDACKDLEFSVGNRRFRSLVTIDAERKSQEAYLYREENGGWAIHGNTKDGKLDDYDDAVYELLGSPRGFFTYVYRRQRARELSGYTKGEMKEIFAELLDVEDLKRKAETARKRKDGLIGTLGKLRQEQQRLEEIASSAAAREAERAEVERKLGEAEGSLNAAERETAALNEEIRALEVKITLQHDLERKRERIEKNLAEGEERAKELGLQLRQKWGFYHAKYRAVSRKLDEARRLAEAAPSLRGAAERGSSIARSISALRATQADLDARYIASSARLTEIARTETMIHGLVKDLETIRLNRSHERELVLHDIRRTEVTEARLAKAPCSSSALASTCRFVQAAAEELKTLPALRKRFHELDRETPEEKKLQERIAALESGISRRAEVEAGMKKSLEESEASKASLVSLERELEALGDEAKGLPEAEAAEHAIPALEQEQKELLAEGNSAVEGRRQEIFLLERETAALRQELDSLVSAGGFEAELQKARRRIEAVTKTVATLRGRQMRLFEKKGKVLEELRQAAVAGKRLAAIDKELKKTNADIAEWAFLERALGNDGLIALEIDDSGPAVAGITNDLIHACFGGRFSVRIDTQGERAKGEGMKEIFDLVVFDAERNEQKSLRSMSGGEKILIEAAVKNALCIFNARRSGIPYGTLFTDEEDGGLDAEKKREFILIKRKVLELGGYEREFFISHTPEVVALADGVLS